jgi:dolichol kinase
MDWVYPFGIAYLLGTVGVFSDTAFRWVAEIVKGTVAFCISALVLGATGWPLAAAFGAYVLGRRFPLYRRLRGAPALEAGVPFLLGILVQAAISGVITWPSVVVAVVVSALLSITRVWQVPVLAASVFIGLYLPFSEGWAGSSPAAVAAAGYLAVESVLSIISTSLFKFGGNNEIKLWRILARPFALLFLPIDLLVSRQALLLVIGIVALIFIVTDFIRLATKRSLSAVFKKKEANRFSSMTLFLVSAFLSFLLFPGTIPYVSLICITFGDFFSKVIGMRFGTITLYKSRTLQGTLAFLAGSLMFNYIAGVFLPIPIAYIAVGCVIAAITELFSEAIDDNFSVSIVTGGVLVAMRYFFSI